MKNEEVGITALNMEHINFSNQSLAAQEAEIYRFVIRTTDLKDPVLNGNKFITAVCDVTMMQQWFYENENRWLITIDG